MKPAFSLLVSFCLGVALFAAPTRNDVIVATTAVTDSAIVNCAGFVATPQYMVFPGWDEAYFETFFLNQGVQMITKDNKTDLNGPAAKKVTEDIARWVKKGYVYWATGKDASSIMPDASWCAGLGGKHTMITGVKTPEGWAILLDGEALPFEHLPSSLPGAGDLYAAILLALLVRGKPLREAAQKAATLVFLAMERTVRERKWGVEVSSIRKELAAV